MGFGSFPLAPRTHDDPGHSPLAILAVPPALASRSPQHRLLFCHERPFRHGSQPGAELRAVRRAAINPPQEMLAHRHGLLGYYAREDAFGHQFQPAMTSLGEGLHVYLPA